jgi:lysine biosynthesis protein LysW
VSTCPNCGADVDSENARLGEVIPCPGCGSDLEVISEDPLTFEVYEQEEK